MTTDLYEAAESLLAPSEPEATEVETNQVEDQTDEADIVDDDPEDATDVDLSDDDDVDASTDESAEADAEADGEDITEDEAEPEPEEAQLFTVVVDGKEEQWTLDELKRSASGQGKINKGFQEVAAAQRSLKERESQLAQYEQAILSTFQAVQAGVNLTAPTPPSESMLQTDPIGYLEADVRYKRELAEYQRNIQSVQQIQQQRQQRDLEAQRAFVEEQARLLAEAIPEYADPQRREGFARSLVEAGQRYNFSAEEMAGVTDMRYVLALNDAKKYHDLMAKRASANSKAKQKPATQPIRAGAKKVADPANTARKKAQERLRRTGSVDDAISLIFNS